MKNKLSKSFRKDSNATGSLKEIKEKFEIENLKENLCKNATMSGFYNKGSERRVLKEDKCNYGTYYTSDKMQIKNVLRKMLDLKKANLQMGKNIVKMHSSANQKEKIIIQLNEEMNYFKNKNENVKQELDQHCAIREICEKNRDGVIDFCQNLKKRYKVFMEIINKYENKIESLNQERESLYKTFENILEMKCKEYFHQFSP